MRLLLAVFTFSIAGALIAAGCGARSSLPSPSEPEDAGVPENPADGGNPIDAGAPLDAGEILDGGIPFDGSVGECGSQPAIPGESCGPLSFSLATQQSCTISLLPGFGMDAEGFITASKCAPCEGAATCDEKPETPCHRILTMSRFGEGHVVAWCDSTSLYDLADTIPVLPYLGRASAPRVALVGDTWPCPPVGPGVPDAIHVGAELPAAYLGDPELLAADWDVVVPCGPLGADGEIWQETLQRFVRDHGKGLLLTQDYKLACPDHAAELAAMKGLTTPFGFVFDAADVSWAGLTVDLDCVTDYPFE